MHVPQGVVATLVTKAQPPRVTPPPEESPLSAGTGCTGSTSSPSAAPTGLGTGRGQQWDKGNVSPEFGSWQ